MGIGYCEEAVDAKKPFQREGNWSVAVGGLDPATMAETMAETIGRYERHWFPEGFAGRTPKSSAGETVYSQTIKSCGSTWSV